MLSFLLEHRVSAGILVKITMRDKTREKQTIIIITKLVLFFFRGKQHHYSQFKTTK